MCRLCQSCCFNSADLVYTSGYAASCGITVASRRWLCIFNLHLCKFIKWPRFELDLVLNVKYAESQSRHGVAASIFIITHCVGLVLVWLAAPAPLLRHPSPGQCTHQPPLAVAAVCGWGVEAHLTAGLRVTECTQWTVGDTEIPCLPKSFYCKKV